MLQRAPRPGMETKAVATVPGSSPAPGSFSIPPWRADDVGRIQSSPSSLRPGYRRHEVDSFLEDVELRLETWWAHGGG